jgi:hypothetical protein
MNRIVQYPHYLFEEDGGGTATFVCRCREETMGWDPAATIQTTLFGKRSSLIQIPYGERKMDVDTMVFVSNDDAGSDIRVRGYVIKYDQGQLHNRLWI